MNPNQFTLNLKDPPKLAPAVNLHDYDLIVINTSGGKDSQTAMRYVVNLADSYRLKFTRERIVAVHADLGEAEWPGVKDLVHQQCANYSIALHVVKYRNKEGKHLSLLDYIRKRGKWPSSKQRYCTSDFKRGPCGTVITKLTKFPRSGGLLDWKVLNVFGFRAEESPARAKRPVISSNGRLSTNHRQVFDWLPIHTWTTEQVWADINESGVPHHPAYDNGMTRLSCRFCFFAPRSQLIVSGMQNPAMLAKYVAVEKEIGHTFKNKSSIAEIAEAIANGEKPAGDNGKWNM